MRLEDKGFPQQQTIKSTQEMFKNTEMMQITQFEKGENQEFQWESDGHQFGPKYVSC